MRIMSAENAQTLLDDTSYMHEEGYALLQDLENYKQDFLGELSVLASDDNLDNAQVQELVLDDQLLSTLTAVTLSDGTQAFIAQAPSLNEPTSEDTTSNLENDSIIVQEIEDIDGKVIQLHVDQTNLEFPKSDDSESVIVPSTYTQLQIIDGVLYVVTDSDESKQVQADGAANNQSENDNSKIIRHERPGDDDGAEVQRGTLNNLRVQDQNNVTNQRPYPCTNPNCKKSFSTAHSLKAHLRTHTGEKPYKCTNEDCDKRFKTSGDLLKHVRTHTGERPFVCPFEGCGRSFTTSNIKKVHIRTHTGERPFKCPQPKCGKAFASSTNYKNHIRIHSGEKPYVCTNKNCGKRFTEYSSLYKHNVVHTPEKPYTCEICNRRYRQHSTLAIHMKTAHSILDSDPDGVLDVLLENSAEMIDQPKELEFSESENTYVSQYESDGGQILLLDDPSQLVNLQDKPEYDIDIALKDLNINMLFNLDEINRN